MLKGLFPLNPFPHVVNGMHIKNKIKVKNKSFPFKCLIHYAK